MFLTHCPKFSISIAMQSFVYNDLIKKNLKRNLVQKSKLLKYSIPTDSVECQSLYGFFKEL